MSEVANANNAAADQPTAHVMATASPATADATTLGSTQPPAVPSAAVTGTTYYVDSRIGNDANNGLSASNATTGVGPWKTLARIAKTSLKAGDAVRLACGATWYESLKLAAAGTSTAPITLGAQPAGCSNRPVVHGGTAIVPSAWKLSSGNVYQTALASPPLQLASTMGVHTLAHHPNQANRGAWTDTVYAAVATDSPTVALQSGGTGSTTLAVGPDLALPSGATVAAGTTVRLRLNSFIIHEATVTGASAASIAFDAPTAYPIKAGWGYYLAGQRWMLDSAGEWYYDPAAKTLYAWMPNGGAPTTTVNAAQRGTAIDLDSSQYVVVDGLAVRHAGVGVNLSRSVGSAVINSALEDLSLNAVIASSSTGARLQANLIARTGRDAVVGNDDRLLPAQRLAVLGNAISQSGVRVVAGRPLSLPEPSRSALRTGVNAVVRGNALVDTSYIGVWSGTGSTIDDNLVQNTCTTLDDCSAIYASGTNNGSRITGNLVLSTRGALAGKGPGTLYTQGQGIYLDESASGALVSGNTVTGSDNGIHLHVAANNTLQGNKLYGNRNAQIWLQETRNTVSAGGDVFGNTVKENLVVPTSATAKGVYVDTIFSDTSHFGSFDYNRYLDRLVTTVANERAGASQIGFNMRQWQSVTTSTGTLRGNEANGWSASKTLFASALINGATIVPNGALLNDAKGWTAWNATSPFGYLVREACPVGWCARYVTGGSLGLMTSPFFSIVAGTWYRLTVDVATGMDKQVVDMVVRRGGGGNNGYASVSDRSLKFVGNTGWTRVSFLFKATTTVNASDPITGDLGARVDFQGIQPGQVLRVSNLELVPTTPADATTTTQLLVNVAGTATAMACPDALTLPAQCGKYVRLSDGQAVVWPYTVGARGSEIVYTRDVQLVDSDNDGIADSQDACPATPAGLAVNSRGCALGQ